MGSIQDLTSDFEDLEVIIKHPTTGLSKRAFKTDVDKCALKTEFDVVDAIVNHPTTGLSKRALKTEVAKYEVCLGFIGSKWKFHKHQQRKPEVTEGVSLEALARLRECCKQARVEVASNRKNKNHQTWGLPFS